MILMMANPELICATVWKLQTKFQAEFACASRVGQLRKQVWQLLRNIRADVRADAQDMEGINNLVTN